jgi:hypothetical protein
MSEEAVDNYVFTQRISRRLDHEEKVGIVEMLWDVAYADGTLHPYEGNPLLGGALIGGVSAFGGNVATQALVEGKSLECVDFSSAGLSGLAGAIGGGFGAKLAAGKTPSFLSLDPSKASLGMFLTPTGQDVVSSSVGGAVGGVLDALLQ